MQFSIFIAFFIDNAGIRLVWSNKKSHFTMSYNEMASNEITVSTELFTFSSKTFHRSTSELLFHLNQITFSQKSRVK